jgi:hypothetical protein
VDRALPAAGMLPWGGLAWEAPLTEGTGGGQGGTFGVLPTGISGVGGTVDGGYRWRMGCYCWWGGNGRLLAARQRRAWGSGGYGGCNGCGVCSCSGRRRVVSAVRRLAGG